MAENTQTSAPAQEIKPATPHDKIDDKKERKKPEKKADPKAIAAANPELAKKVLEEAAKRRGIIPDGYVEQASAEEKEAALRRIGLVSERGTELLFGALPEPHRSVTHKEILMVSQELGGEIRAAKGGILVWSGRACLLLWLILGIIMRVMGWTAKVYQAVKPGAKRDDDPLAPQAGVITHSTLVGGTDGAASGLSTAS